jgi:hypothetical protein
MIFDALKTSSGNQNTLLVNDIVEHKTLSDGGYCVMPRPMKSFVKHREIDDGLQSNVFSADTIDLDDGGISKNVNLA